MARVKSGTLTPNVVATVTIDDAWPNGLEIVNRSQTGAIWVRLDGLAPTVAGDDCFTVLGARFFENPWSRPGPIVVKLISDQALNYTVEGDPQWVSP